MTGVDSIVRVLVVDDSAFVRKVVREVLARSPFVEVVGTARNGAEALDLVTELDPDVVTCDLVMPELDGLAFVREQMQRRPVPIVLISSVRDDEQAVLSALEAGAVDFVQKPTSRADDRMFEIGAQLVAKVKAAGGARRERLAGAPGRPAPAVVTLPAVRAGAGLVDVVVIGISTGGPQALRQLVPRLPADCPVPVVIALHMPVGYTELYAQKLDQASPLTVTEARHGDPIKPGRVLVAPGGQHLTFARRIDGVAAEVDSRRWDMLYRPSVDLLFQSAAEVYGGRVLAVVMTGMGSDGLEGARRVKAGGGAVLTEAEESCVVYGMPRSVVEAGLSDESVPLDGMARAILERV